jgi:hypothetical protein
MSQRETECFGAHRREKREERDWFGLVEFGFFLILIGALFLVIQNLFGHAETFIRSFNQTQEIFSGIHVPVPNVSADNTEFYRATMYFCFASGAFRIIILILRFAAKSSIHKKAGILGGIVFWLGAGLLANTLVTSGSSYWLLFIGGLIVLIGLSVMVRAFATLLFRST